jgi:GxxExxY protein
LKFEELSGIVIGCAIEVHNELGPGLLESTYRKCLGYELARKSINFVSEAELPIVYKGINISSGYRIDLLVENKMILELKSVDLLMPVHEAQLLTYMKLTSIPVGLLINFNVVKLKDGIKRFVI